MIAKISKALFTITIAVVAKFANAQTVHGTANSSSNSNIVFFDDFSENLLDRTKWNVIVTGFHVNNEQQAFVDSVATIYTAKGAQAEGAKNGALVIESRFCKGFVTKDGQHFDFISGRIDTKNKVEFTYGTATARMKLPAGSGLWPAFWLLGNGKWPDCGEVDIMENVGETDWTSVALHGPGYFGETPLVNKVFFKPHFDVTKWHEYSVDWAPEGLNFKADGQLIYRATRTMIEHYGKWAFDNPKYVILNLALGGAYPYKTNGVTTPYNGIPDSAVQSIKNRKAKVFVDWVKITKNK